MSGHEWTQEDIINLLRQGVIKFETREEEDGLHVSIWLGDGIEQAIHDNAHALHWYLTHVTPLSN